MLGFDKERENPSASSCSSRFINSQEEINIGAFIVNDIES